jgi:ribosomal protein L24E
VRQVRSLLVAAAMVGSVFVGQAPADATTEVHSDASYDNGSGYDGRGDLQFVGADFTDGRFLLAASVRTGEDPRSYNWVSYTTGILWRIDVHGDGVADYDVYYANVNGVYANLHIAGDTANPLCRGYTDFDGDTYFAGFTDDCIGGAQAFQLKAFMSYETSYSESGDLAPNSGWCCVVSNSVTPPSPPPPAPPPPSTDDGSGFQTAGGEGSGYWMLSSGGPVYNFGDARHFGNSSSGAVDIEPVPQFGNGYWVLTEQGAVLKYGAAGFFGGNPPLQPGEKAASLSVTPSGNGYWIFTSMGRVFAYGDAPHFGDMAGVKLNGAVLDSVATFSGRGYWMVASDGGIFAFGDAKFFGSMGGKPLNQPVMSMAPDPDGVGYWLVSSDGGIFAFDAPFYGSMGSQKLNKPISGMVPGDAGYLMVAEDGGIFSFGNVKFHGSLGANPSPTPVVAVALLP